MFVKKDEVSISTKHLKKYTKTVKNLTKSEDGVEIIKTGRVTQVSGDFAEVDFWDSIPSKFTIEKNHLILVKKAPEHANQATGIGNIITDKQAEAITVSKAIKPEVKKAMMDKLSSVQDPPQIKEPKKTGKALDVQISGSHYKKLKIQPVVYIMENNLNFLQGNVVKYITRYKDKKGKEDLEKAIHCLQLLIEMEYNEDGTVKS